jgi:hypothetical protein
VASALCGGKDNARTAASLFGPLLPAGVVHSTLAKALTGALAHRITRSRCWWAWSPAGEVRERGRPGRTRVAPLISTEASSCLVVLCRTRSGAALKRWPGNQDHE